ncbi:MAG TPA: YceI family protein [Pseudonocardiaceae bacterium]|nr:YceI family protein [Pseudonocardiaceae bacterium]
MSMAGRGSWGSSLIGTVVTPDGWPVPHAVITVVDEKGSQSGRSTAGHDGRFAVEGLRQGTYTVITAAAGHAPQARTRLVNGAGSVDLGRLVLTRVGGAVLPLPGTWHIDPIHSTISATAVHIGFAKIHGRFREFAGSLTIAEPLEDSSVEVLIDAASIDTDNADRDAHLRSPDFLDVTQFPQIRYTGRGPIAVRPDTWQLVGELTMKNITRPVPLHVNYLGTGDGPFGDTRSGFHVTTELDRDQFGIIWNQSLLAGVFAVGRTLRVTIDIEAVYQQP